MLKLPNLIILAALLLSRIFSQELPFTQYTPDNEVNPLPSASIDNIHQDRLGFIWICVYSSGMVRYNGHSMELYDIDDGLPNVNVMNMTEDASGRLWVLTDGGAAVTTEPLAHYDANHPVRFSDTIGGKSLLRASISQVAPNALAADISGNIWIGTTGLGIIRYRLPDLQTVIADTFSISLSGEGPNPIVYSLLCRQDNSVVTGVEGGLLKFDSTANKFRPWPETAAYSLANTHALFESASGELWGGCADGLLWRLAEKNGRDKIEITNRQLRSVVYSILKDRKGNMWAGSYGSGVLKIPSQQPQQGQVYTRANGLLSDNIQDILQDREGNIWIAQTGGVSKLRYNHEAFINLSEQSLSGEGTDLSDININAIIPPETAGAQFPLWLATGGGVLRLQDYGDASRVDMSNGLPTNIIYDICRDEKGRLWIGNFSGLNCLSGPDNIPQYFDKRPAKKIRFREQDKFLSFFDVGIIGVCNSFFIPVDENVSDTVETLWFNSYRRIVCFADEEWFIFDEESGIPATIIYSLAMDKEFNLWVGTGEYGLLQSAEPITLNFLKDLKRNPEDGLVTEKVFEPALDSLNNDPLTEVSELICPGDSLWIGTPRGLYIVDRNTFTVAAHLSKSNGLRNNNIVSMDISRDGNSVWVGSNEGLAEIDLKNLRVLRTATREDGLLSSEATWLESLKAAKNGLVYFGTPKGLAIYNPELDRANSIAPAIYFRQNHFQENNSGQNELTLEWVALGYANEKQVRYKTRLRNYDRDYSAETSENKIRYTNLPAFFTPARYTFEVLAANNSGLWSEAPLIFSFMVSPPWWMRWWAFILYGAGAILLFRAGKWIAANWRDILTPKTRFVSHYRLVALLGRGGMGQVYQAVDVNDKKTVALKLLNEELVQDEENRKRLVNEGRLLASLSHPNIVKIFEFGETEAQCFLAMEYLTGGTLRAYLAQHFPLTDAEIKRLLLQIAAGLGEIHARGIIHRDIKTANIMLDESGNVRIMDFGLSKSHLVTTLTSTGTLLGTLGYVAPEQITGVEVDQRADIFSFGVVIFELLTGKLPFNGENEMALIHAIFNTEPPPPSQLRPGEIDRRWDEIVARCLAKNPRDRFQSIEKIISAISDCGLGISD